jgi:predicted transcriptional regulator
MAASLKKFMQQISGKKAPGPQTSFTIFHVFHALELLAHKPLGRNKLAEKLEVGDGAVRTIIGRLKEAGLIQISKAGCVLTKKGMDVWQRFEEIFPKRVDLPKTQLSDSEFNHAFLVRDSAQKVGSGIDQRDAAIIAGARRALVVVSKKGCLCIAQISDCVEKDYPNAAKILKELNPQDNDVIIIAGADSALRAERGAFAASWSLVSV